VEWSDSLGRLATGVRPMVSKRFVQAVVMFLSGTFHSVFYLDGHRFLQFRVKGPPREIVGFLTEAPFPEGRPMRCPPPPSGLFALRLLSLPGERENLLIPARVIIWIDVIKLQG
jgi:hypothetical protein